MDKKSKADLDRNLYEYQRQLDAPKIFADKYPNISKAVDSKILHKDNQDIYNTLGKNIDKQNMDPFNWYRNSEEAASNATASDGYGTNSLYQLFDLLKKKDNLDYKVLEKEDDTNNGAYMPDKNTIQIDPRLSRTSAIDAAMHEHQHVKENKQDTKRFMEKIDPNEHTVPLDVFSKGMDRWNKMKDTNNLYDLSEEISRDHFFKPRSSSINTLIEKSEELGKENGLSRLPDRNPKYDELNYIKPTLKDLQGYNPKKEGIYDKLKKLLTR